MGERVSGELGVSSTDLQGKTAKEKRREREGRGKAKTMKGRKSVGGPTKECVRKTKVGKPAG